VAVAVIIEIAEAATSVWMSLGDRTGQCMQVVVRAMSGLSAGSCVRLVMLMVLFNASGTLAVGEEGTLDGAPEVDPTAGNWRAVLEDCIQRLSHRLRDRPTLPADPCNNEQPTRRSLRRRGCGRRLRVQTYVLYLCPCVVVRRLGRGARETRGDHSVA